MKNYLFNPFVKIAGLKSLLIGVAILLLTSIISIYSNCHFDGAIDVHVGKQSPAIVYFAETIIAWISLFLTLFIAGKIVSKSSIRLIDVAGTTAVARAPMLIVSLLAFSTSGIVADINNIHPVHIIFGLIALIFSIWMITLLYNAFSVSCNAKGNNAVVAFISALIAAEILSKLALHQIYKSALFTF